MSTAIESSPLPGRAAVRSLVEDLVGRPVELGDVAELTLIPQLQGDDLIWPPVLQSEVLEAHL